MNFMSYHLLKMKELRQYREIRKKANLIADISTILLLLFVGLIIYLRVVIGG